MFTRIYNIVVAVNDIEEATKMYADNLGMKLDRSGTAPDLGLKNAFFNVGDAVIELVEPLDHEQGPVAKFLQNKGEGVYMIDLEVENVDSAVKSFTEKGVRLLGADPEARAKGSRVFIHPQSTRGVLVQLVEKA